MPLIHRSDITFNMKKSPIDFDKKLLIGICGKKETGKDTVAHKLKLKAERIGLSVAITAFGYALKNEVSQMYHIPIELMQSQEGKAKIVTFKIAKDGVIPKTPDTVVREYTENELLVDIPLRSLLQWYGTEYRRKQDSCYWTKATVYQINQLFQIFDIVILTDLRFPNECETVRRFTKNHIFRMHPYPNYVYTKASKHISETALDDYKDIDEHCYPKFGDLHLTLVANKLFTKYIVPFKSYISGEDALPINI